MELCYEREPDCWTFCTSLSPSPTTEGLALLFTAAVCDDCGPEAQDAEDGRRGEHHGAQVDQSHKEGIVETVVGRVHVRGQRDNGAIAETQGKQDLDPRIAPHIHAVQSR